MYPWAGFGAFLFRSDERPERDSGWQYSPSISRGRTLGSTTDSIVALSIGSPERSLEQSFDQDRFAAIRALINTTALLTDWGRPTPASQNAFLQNVRELDRFAVLCTGGETKMKIRARLEFIAQ